VCVCLCVDVCVLVCGCVVSLVGQRVCVLVSSGGAKNTFSCLRVIHMKQRLGKQLYIYLAMVMRTRDASYMFSLPPDATHTSPCKECLSVFSVRYLKPLCFQEFAPFLS